MSPFEEFEQHLQAALTSIYNPNHRPPAVVWSVLGVDGQEEIKALWGALASAIGELRPAPDLPAAARMRRVYDVLHYRYVQSLTQEASAERLGISPRHLRREQREAVHVLAERLWARRARALASGSAPAVGDRQEGPSAEDYLAQVRQELASLRHQARNSSANVGAVFSRVTDLVRDVASGRGIAVDVAPVPATLVAAIHPSALRQALLAAVREATERMAAGRIALTADRSGRCVRVSFEASPVADDGPPDIRFVDEIMSWSGGSAEGAVEGDRLTLSLLLPVADPIRVLVLDDNPDMVHFFRRYVAGSRYTIIVAEGAHAFLDLVDEISPDIIVLDVMLPEVDGWDVLMHLNTRPETCEIPVIVCSVVRERELALSLGAAVYLPKPVRRQEFIQALDQALARVVAGTGTPAGCTPIPC
jgi:CheY-like chemotaxis protein